jgi:AcrR family transcriptional regulator
MSDFTNAARERILACGKEQLLAGHYASFGVRDFVRACGISTGTFYRQFRTKDDVMLAVLDADWAALLRELEDKFSPEQPARENIRLLFACIAAFAGRYTPSVLGALDRTEQFRRAEQKGMLEICGLTERMLRSSAAREGFGADFDAKKAAWLAVQVGIAVGREGKLSFDDVWNILGRLGCGGSKNTAGGTER